jgi:hypothetical protein
MRKISSAFTAAFAGRCAVAAGMFWAMLYVSSPATALTVTVTGTIASWIWNGNAFVEQPLVDVTGVFGQAGASLTGNPFTVFWTIDTTCVGCTHVDPSWVYGGSQAGTQSPIVSTVLTINGDSISFSPGLYGVVQEYNNGPAHSFGFGSGFYVNVTERLVPNFALNTFIDSNTPFFNNFISTFDYTFDPLTDNLTAPHQLGGGFEYGGLNGYFNIQHIVAVSGPLVGTGLPGFFFAISLLIFYRRKHSFR